MNHFTGMSPTPSIGGARRQTQQARRDNTREVDIKSTEASARTVPAILELHKTECVRWPEDYATDLDMLTTVLTIAIQTERQRLVRVLNNNVTASIVAARLQLCAVAQSTTDTAASNALREIEGCLAASMKAARDMMADLNSFISDEHGLHALDACVAQSNLRAALTSVGQQFLRLHGVEVHITGICSIEPSSEMRFALLRSVRKLLMNTVRFSGVTHARIQLGNDDRWLRVEVYDEGIDANSSTQGPGAEYGFGLRSIHARLAAIGGRMEVTSANGRGTTVTMLIPVTTTCSNAERAHSYG